MLEDLEAYLDASTTQEMRNLILDSCQTLTRAGVENHLFLLRNAIDIAEGLEFDTVYEGIYGTLKPLFVGVLKEFGIQVDDDIDLRTLNSILKGLKAIDNWDDPDTINGLTDAVEGNEAALADILVIVGDLSIGDYMQALVRVSTDLITRIAEVTNKEGPEPQPDELAVAAAQIRLRALLPKANFDDNSIFIQALDNGLRLGMSFELTIESHIDALHQLPVEKLAAEMVAFAFASAAQIDAIPTLLNKLKESFSLSITDLMQLDAEIKRLL